MNRELAKQLKDAGFPRPEMRCSYCVDAGYASCSLCEDQVEASPTLEELIKELRWCTDRFCLEQHSNDWRAGIYQGIKQSSSGANPSEAVANLWLALNQNKHA